MIRSTYITLLALAITVGSLAAQEEIPPPRAPFVAPIPGFADWSIRAVPPAAQGQDKGPSLINERTPVVTQTTRTQSIRHRVVTYGDGSKLETWQSGTAMMSDLDASQVAVADMTQVQSFDLATQDIFQETAWVNIQNYQGIAILDKAKYYHYASGDQEAWIDIATKLPVAYKKDGLLYRFQFNTPPTALLVLPERYQEAMAKYIRMMDRRARLAKEIK